MEGLLGDTVIEVSATTFKVDEAVKFPDVPEMVVDPLLRLAAKPCVPALLLMVATAGLEELHDVLAVTSFVDPSLRLSEAWNC